MIKDPVKLTVGLGFTGVLTLMGLISIISLSQMSALTEQTSTLLDETSTKISAANTMRDSIRQRGNTLYKMFLTEDYFERDEYRQEFAEHALRYREARKILHSFQMSSREAKLLDQLMKQTGESEELNNVASDDLLSNLPDEEIRQDLLIANQARLGVLERLNELVILQEEINRGRIEEANQLHDDISNIVFLLSLAAFLIAVYIAQLVIRETSKKNSEIHYQATHDELTKLVNRKEFNHRLVSAFNTAKEDNENHVLCFLDLDKFKSVNDNCGHKAGDELLIQLTAMINNHIRSHDTLARIGGDEFGLLLEGCSLEKAIEIAEGIVSLVKNYEFIWQNKIFHVGVSIGISTINRETKNIEAALSQADIACYAAKDLGRNQVQVHGLIDDRVEKIHKELKWVSGIHSAANSSHFELHLQAIRDIQSGDTATMYEVLLRLNDDKGTLVSPGSYISTAERFSLMLDVDRWVIEHAFKYLAQLYRTVVDCKLKLFINISSNSLNDNAFSEFVIRQHQKYNIPHNAICLEVSEVKAIKNINQAADVISSLRQHSIQFALDDYGAEIPSFSYLKNLPVDFLKIDGSIIRNMSHNTADKAMVAAVNQIGKVMNISIIAKHVENAFTLNQLKQIGIEYAQGYHLDDTISLNDLQKILKQGNSTRMRRH